VKGGGGALLREKIVASAAKRFIVVADASKIVFRLGKFPLPVEVIPMAAPLVEKKILALGIRSKVRQAKAGGDYITDEGNLILDCACGEIADPNALAASIRAMVGVVEHGLFLNMAEMALVADGAEVKTIYK
jgi:ribose 5-phosphate isomerase A